MKVVLDTNVLVSGLLSPYGPRSQIVLMVASGTLTLYYDARLLTEYREVLLRPKFPFEAEAVEALLDQITALGELVASEPLAKALPDPDDEPFLEVAVAASAEALVTGNIKHYPPESRAGILVCSPAELVEHLRRAKA